MESQKINDHIVNWLKIYAKEAKIKGFVIGISGGIDSAVTSMLCAQTGLSILCVKMPIHQDLSHVTRANEHIDYLKKIFSNVKSITMDLTSTFDIFSESITPMFLDEDKVNFTLANTRARFRMATLYFYAGIDNLLVVGTGNKIEDFGVGFYTKYGDGGVDLSPIADLMKSEVYELAKFLNIPLSIQSAAPTDGLFGNNRTDEDQLGASYDELEWAMNYVENKSDYELTAHEVIVLDIYKSRHSANQHKMLPIPVCEIPKEFKK